MPTIDLRDCECDPATRHTNLSSIVVMFSCAKCGCVDKITAADIDGLISILTALRATAVPGRVTPEGVEPAAHPAD